MGGKQLFNVSDLVPECPGPVPHWKPIRLARDLTGQDEEASTIEEPPARVAAGRGT
jgi:hypothetical protein